MFSAGKALIGAIMVIVGVIWGFIVKWKIDFDSWYNWVWLLFLVIGCIVLIEFVITALYAIGIGFVVIGIIWGGKVDWAYIRGSTFSVDSLWVYLIAVGIAIIVINLIIHIIRGKKWFRNDEKKEKHECPDNTIWSDEEGACIFTGKKSFF